MKMRVAKEKSMLLYLWLGVLKDLVVLHNELKFSKQLLNCLAFIRIKSMKSSRKKDKKCITKSLANVKVKCKVVKRRKHKHYGLVSTGLKNGHLPTNLYKSIFKF